MTVRTLHHYDEIGLLVPSERTASGHRLYTYHDVARLQQIQSLRMLGFSLDVIRQMLDTPEQLSSQQVVTMQLERLEQQIADQQQLAARLRKLTRYLDSTTDAPVTDLCAIIDTSLKLERYFTSEQLATLDARSDAIGAERIRAVEAEWAEIIPAVRAHMVSGTPPDDPALQALAIRWKALVDEFTGGDADLARRVRLMYDAEHETINAVQPHTPDPAMFAFMRPVFAGLGGGPG
jgi:DNA-binding transcriptional MerR regulator